MIICEVLLRVGDGDYDAGIGLLVTSRILQSDINLLEGGEGMTKSHDVCALDSSGAGRFFQRARRGVLVRRDITLRLVESQGPVVRGSPGMQWSPQWDRP